MGASLGRHPSPPSTRPLPLLTHRLQQIIIRAPGVGGLALRRLRQDALGGGARRHKGQGRLRPLDEFEGRLRVVEDVRRRVGRPHKDPGRDALVDAGCIGGEVLLSGADAVRVQVKGVPLQQLGAQRRLLHLDRLDGGLLGGEGVAEEALHLALEVAAKVLVVAHGRRRLGQAGGGDARRGRDGDEGEGEEVLVC